jgi:nucleoside-diphosphate-sugar epimerase
MEIRGSFERLRAATGWEPEIPLHDTLRDTVAWWREQLREEAHAPDGSSAS